MVKKIAASEHIHGNKTHTAHKIWDNMFESMGAQMSRHEAIEAAVTNAGMTKASAATLYQNWRDEHGLVNHDNPGGAASIAHDRAVSSASGSYKSKRR